MRTNILITGVNGFVGSYLAELLLTEQEVSIHGVLRNTRSSTENIDSIINRIELHTCDLTDSFNVANIIEKLRPETIFHFGANSYVGASWDSPSSYVTAGNPDMVLNLLEGVKRLKLKEGYNPVIFIACTSEEYGLVISSMDQYLRLMKDGKTIWPAPLDAEGNFKSEVPIKETNPLRPLSPYAVGKIVKEMLARQYHASYGLRTIPVRCFNQEGPRRGKEFVVSNFAKQIAEIEKGKQEAIIRHGNLDAQRDWVDVRDSIKAYRLLSKANIYGEPINVGSGTCYSVKEMLDLLLGLTHIDIKLTEESWRFRPSDVPILQADISRVKEITRWQPEIPLKQTLSDMLNYWRKRV